ncbi:hypothetical protein H0H93_014006 [Arthromyces matolae]|nr:hypothetical protein H0H93_014006 [Arthromyces matolae]
MAASSKLKLNCLVLGEPIENMFEVRIEADESVAALRNAIKAAITPAFAHVGVRLIYLWKVSIAAHVHFNLDPKNFVDEPLLQPWEELGSLFTDPPVEGHVHIIVKPPPQYLREKMTHRLSEEGPWNDLKRRKLATTPPPVTGDPLEYKRLQNLNDERILDDRPQPDDDIPPVSLLYDGFGLFLDILRGKKDIPLLTEIDIPRLRQEVDEFADQMCEFYEKEADRRDTALPILEKIFSARGDVEIPSIQPCDNGVGSVTSGGHNTAKCVQQRGGRGTCNS